MIKRFLQSLFFDSYSKVRQFTTGRIRETDDQFLDSCEIKDDVHKRIAIASRRAIANVGLVDSQFIHQEDKWPEDLGVLPTWDSMDSVCLVMELEEELEVDISEEEAEKIFNYNSFVVRDFVHNLCGLLELKVKEIDANKQNSVDETTDS